MKFGLSRKATLLIQSVFVPYVEVESVVIYGSRAKGNFKPGSDIDLTMKGDGLTLRLQNTIANKLDDLMLPYTFDLSVYSQISNPDLIDHIERVGIEFYNSEKNRHS